MRFTTAIAMLLTCAGCGADDIVLEVRSQRTVPTAVDTMRATVGNTEQTDTLRSVLVELDQSFPVTVLFEAGDDTPARLRFGVEIRLGATLVDSGAIEADREGGTTRVVLDLDL